MAWQLFRPGWLPGLSLITITGVLGGMRRNIKFYVYSRLSHSESLTSNNNEEVSLRRRSQVTDLDITKEKRTQKFLLLILISQFVCIAPINVLKYV